MVGDVAGGRRGCRRRRSPQSPSSLAWDEPKFDGDAQQYPFHLPAVCLVGVSRWLAGAPAVAAGTARSADVGDVEQLGRDQSGDSGRSSASPTATSSMWPRRTARCARPRCSRRALRLTSWPCRPGRATRRSRATRAVAGSEPGRSARTDDRVDRTGAIAWAATRVKIVARRRTGRTTDPVRRRHRANEPSKSTDETSTWVEDVTNGSMPNGEWPSISTAAPAAVRA